MEARNADPTVLTARRTITFLVSLLVTLGSGTNYVGDVWLYGKRCELNMKRAGLFRYASLKGWLVHGESDTERMQRTGRSLEIASNYHTRSKA